MTTGATPEREDDPIELRFDLEADDLVKFARDAARVPGGDPDADPARRRSARAYLLLTLTLVAIGVSLLVLQPMKQFGSGPEAAAVIAFGIFALWTGTRALTAALTRTSPVATSIGAERDDGETFGLGEQTMILGPAGVVIRLEHQEILLRWSGVTDIDQTESCFYIKRLDRVCFIAPRRAFTDYNQLARTVARCRAWHSAFAESESDLVTRLCAERDFTCPSCAYNLRGHRAGPCPECGVLIDAAAMLRLAGGQQTVGIPPPIDPWALGPAPGRDQS